MSFDFSQIRVSPSYPGVSFYTKCIDFLEVNPKLSVIALAILSRLNKKVSFKNSSLNLVVSGAINTTSLVISIFLIKHWGHLFRDFTIMTGLKSFLSEPTYTSRVYLKEGVEVAVLDYQLIGQRRCPVLTLNIEDPYEQGYAHGYLLGKQVSYLLLHAFAPMLRTICMQDSDLFGCKIKEKGEALYFTDSEEKQIQGLLDGVRRYSEERGVLNHVTREDIHQIHVIADTYKQVFFSLGCSCLVVKREDKMVMGRTMEWPQFAELGVHFFLLRNKVTGVEKFTVPGFLVGAVTGGNESLHLVLNECGNVTKKIGTPYTVVANRILEQAHSIEDIKKLLKVWKEEDPKLLPAASCNMIIMDRTDSVVFQFYAEQDKLYTLRGMEKISEELEGLVVANHAENEGRVIPSSLAAASSKERSESMHSTISRYSNEKLIQIVTRAIKDDKINKPSTIKAVVYSNTKVEPLKSSFSTSYAARRLFSHL